MGGAGRVLGNCEAPGLNQSGIAGRWPAPAPIPLWILSRSMLGRVPALGVEGRVPAPAPGRVAGACPAEGRLGVDGRVDGCPAEGRLGVEGRVDGCPAEGRLGADGAGRVDGRCPAEGLLAEGVLGRLIDGERLAEEAPPPPARPPPPPPRPPRWAKAGSATSVRLKTKTIRIRACLLIGIPPSHFSARPSLPSGG